MIVVTQKRGRYRRGRLDDVHRLHARFNHADHFAHFKISRIRIRRSAVGTEDNPHAAIGHLLQIFHCRGILLSKGAELRVPFEFVHRDRIGKIGRELSRINFTHRLFAKPAWLICIFELGFGSGQSGSQKNILFLHCRDQLVVDVAVTDAADESINPCLDQIFCVGQLENFRNNL